MSLATDFAQKFNGKTESVMELTDTLLRMVDNKDVIDSVLMNHEITVMFVDGSVLSLNMPTGNTIQMEVLSATSVLYVLRHYAPYTDLIKTTGKLN